MTIVQAIVLGLIQGLTEFLPISSSAHLIVIPWLCGWPDPGLAFDVSLHVGTLLALLLYFWRDWLVFGRAMALSLVGRSSSPDDARLGWALVLATIPGGVVGLLGEKAIDAFFHSEEPSARRIAVLSIAAALALLALALAAAERFAVHRRDHRDLSVRDAFLIGCAQALALFPGVSRSGATLTAGLGLGLKRESAARFSFLLAMPITAGAGAKKLLDIAHGGLPAGEGTMFVIGTVVATVSGIAAIHALLRFLRSHSTYVFVVYRILLAVGLVALAFGRVAA